MKKNVFRFVCALLVAAVCLPMIACGGASSGAQSSGEKVDAIKEQLLSTLSQVKDCEGEPFKLVLEAIAAANIEDYLTAINMTDEELARAYLAKFDFTIDDVTVTGTSAQAKVTLTRPSIVQIVKDYLTSGHVGEGETGKQALLDAIAAAEPQTKEMRLGLTPQGDSWNVVEALQSALPHAVQ